MHQAQDIAMEEEKEHTWWMSCAEPPHKPNVEAGTANLLERGHPDLIPVYYLRSRIRNASLKHMYVSYETG